jgi:hypothetical protein
VVEVVAAVDEEIAVAVAVSEVVVSVSAAAAAAIAAEYGPVSLSRLS